MGEAKRRGSQMDRVRQAQDAIELARIMAEKQKRDEAIRKQEAFEALPVEEQERIHDEQLAEYERRKRARALLVSALAVGMSI